MTFTSSLRAHRWAAGSTDFQNGDLNQQVSASVTCTHKELNNHRPPISNSPEMSAIFIRIKSLLNLSKWLVLKSHAVKAGRRALIGRGRDPKQIYFSAKFQSTNKRSRETKISRGHNGRLFRLLRPQKNRCNQKRQLRSSFPPVAVNGFSSSIQFIQSVLLLVFPVHFVHGRASGNVGVICQKKWRRPIKCFIRLIGANGSR